MRTTTPVRWCVSVVAVLVASTALIFGVGRPAIADPGDEGGSESLRQQLDSAARGYLEATTKLENSRKRQDGLSNQVAAVEVELAEKSEAVAVLAAEAYRSGPLASVSSLFASENPDVLMERLTLLGAISSHDHAKLDELAVTKDTLAEAKAAVDGEIAQQRKQQDEMATRKRAAEKALAQVGGGQTAGYASAGSASAQPAPRNADGSWPAESCSVDDPTTSGCITPRTLHAMQQARAAGYTHYVSCYRSGGSGEHPKGRACDFAAATSGFAGTAAGAERTYGNNLAAYFVANASRLGVLYVIWYRQIWMASTGWRAYIGGGTPSSDHTNHVHLSMY